MKKRNKSEGQGRRLPFLSFFVVCGAGRARPFYFFVPRAGGAPQSVRQRSSNRSWRTLA